MGPDATLEEIAKKLGNGSQAVLVAMNETYGIITKQDIIGKLK
jgi:predicted transcriptional regulator